MAQTVAPPPPESNRLQRRFAGLRRRLRIIVAFRGVGWLLAVVLLGALVAGLLDWRFQLPSLVRALFLVGILSGAGYIFYRYLFLPLADRVDDLALALRVEEQHGGLDDALASTVEFLQQPADSEVHGSPGLRREAVRQALRRTENCDFNKVIDRRGLRLAGVLLFVSVALAATALVLWPAAAQKAVARLANPFGGVEWPRQTQLEIDPPRERIGSNEAFEVRGRVRGVIPEKAVVVFQFQGSQVVEHTCDIVREEGADFGTLATVLKPDSVQRKFRFQVRANDAVSRWYDVAVLPPPGLVPPSPLVRVQPPAYTDLPAYNLPDGSGDVEAVLGTQVTLRALADRPLARAWIEFDPEPWFSDGEVPARLDPDRQRLTATFVPRIAGRYVLHIEDDSGLRYNRVFDLQVQADPAPLVNLERPSDKRDILHMLPTAELPLRASVEDPLFAVRSAWLEYRVRKAANPAAARTDPPLRLPLYDHQTAGKAVWGPFASLTAPVRMREKRVEIDQRLALAKLPEVQLKEGDVLILQVCADDFDDVTLNKEPGRSHEVEVRIVSRESLDNILIDEQMKVQQELVRLHEQEREALKKVAETQARLRQLEKLDGEDAARLQKAEELQEQIRDRIGARRQEGLRREVARIQETLRNNQLPRSVIHDRMQQVAEQLERLAREELEPIEARLASARKQSESPEERQLEKQRQARLLESLAEEKDEEAKKAERLAAERPEGDPLRGTLQKAAKFFQQQAQELRQTAQALRQDRDEPQPEREKRARLLEELAQEKERDAAMAQQLAERQPENDPNRAAAEDNARQMQQAAQDLRQAAQEQRQGQTGDNNVKEQLAEARRHQEEVEKTLADLRERLDPFASTAEIKGDAKTMLQEQRRLLQQNEELKTKDPPEQAQLEQMKDDQRRLMERANQLLNKMDRVAEERDKKGDKETAQELRSARDAAQRGPDNLPSQMKSANDQMQKGHLNEAAQSQKAGVRKLEELVKQLEDRREAELDRLAKRMRELEKEMEKLAEEQERLQKKVKDAAAIADPQKREEELKKLARQQKQLQEQARQMADNLSRLRTGGRAGQEMAEAANQMEDALKRLERGQNPEEPQEEALDRLDEARREMEQARREAEEELAREQLAKVADQLKNIKERHEALIKERERIREDVAGRGWTGGLITSLNDLGRNQKELALDTRTLVENKLAAAKVLAHILDRAAQAMDQAGQRILDHPERIRQRLKDAPAGDLEKAKKFQPDDQAAFEQTAAHQQDALRRLEQILEAIKEELARPMRGGGGAGGGEGGEGGGGGGGRPGDNIPPLAQLKLLRTMQADVNQRTDAFHKKHPDPNKLTPEQRTELQTIEREQREVANLLDELVGPAKPEGDRP